MKGVIMASIAYKKATGTKNKELFIIPNATHIQTYYVPGYVDAASGKIVEFFNKNLK